MSIRGKEGRKTVFISIPIGRAVKYFLDTELYSLLKAHYYVCIFCPFSDSDEFRKKYGGPWVEFFAHPGIRLRSWKASVLRIYMKLRLLHSDFRLQQKESGQLRLEIRKVMLHNAYWPARMNYEFFRGLGGWHSFNALTKWLFADQYYLKVCKRRKPGLIVSASPCKSISDYCLQYCAVKNKIPLIFFPASWDNFTQNGEFPFLPTRIFSWGPEMSRHAKEFFGFQDELIFNGGIIRFEKCGNNKINKNSFNEIMSIPEGHKIILFPTNQIHLIRAEGRILEEMVVDIQNSVFGKAILLIRPNNMHTSATKGYIKKYGNNPFVRFNIPEEDGADFAFREPEVSWNNAIACSDLIVTGGCSMILLEAFHWDKPVVQYKYDYNISNDYGFSHQKYFNREVVEKIFSCGATAIATSRLELNLAIRAYLSNPTLHRENRKRALSYWDVDPPRGTSRCKLVFDEIMHLLHYG